MNKKLINRIQELFFNALESKTGWGKLDIKDCYRSCVNEALLEMVDTQQKALKQLGQPNKE